MNVKPVPPHGTNRRYQSKRAPCRCVACREAHRDDMRRRRASDLRWRRVTTIRHVAEPEHIATILPRVLQALGRAD